MHLMRTLLWTAVHVAALSLSGLAPSEARAVPVFDFFGPLNEATFGGTGIPNDEVAVATQFVDGDNLITVALSATQRFSNPPLTNDGAGTYFATPGSNFGGAGESTTEGALWNFSSFIRVEGLNGATPVLTDYQIDIFYDFDPGFDTPLAGLGRIDVTASLLAGLGGGPGSTLEEDSQNLLFNFLSVDTPPFIDAPAGSFDPNVLGEYNFAVQVSSAGGFGVETVAMDVQVVPEPGTALLIGLGLAGLSTASRSRSRS